MEFYNEGGIATFKKGDWAKRKKKNQMKEAKRQFKDLVDEYKNKPLDKEAVRESYKIFTKPPGPRR